MSSFGLSRLDSQYIVHLMGWDLAYTHPFMADYPIFWLSLSTPAKVCLVAQVWQGMLWMADLIALVQDLQL